MTELTASTATMEPRTKRPRAAGNGRGHGSGNEVPTQEQTKRCSGCGEVKPLDRFSRSKMGRLGRQSRCKACVREYQREWIKRPENQERQRAAMRRSKARNPERNRARESLRRAVANGRIVRPDACEECGQPCKPEAHHHDYAKPYDVRWLCRSCHRVQPAARAPAPLVDRVRAALDDEWASAAVLAERVEDGSSSRGPSYAVGLVLVGMCERSEAERKLNVPGVERRRYAYRRPRTTDDSGPFGKAVSRASLPDLKQPGDG